VGSTENSSCLYNKISVYREALKTVIVDVTQNKLRESSTEKENKTNFFKTLKM
jgi:hypothetical protein